MSQPSDKPFSASVSQFTGETITYEWLTPLVNIFQSGMLSANEARQIMDIDPGATPDVYAWDVVPENASATVDIRTFNDPELIKGGRVYLTDRDPLYLSELVDPKPAEPSAEAPSPEELAVLTLESMDRDW